MTPVRLLIIAPNWIGDAIMAHPLIQLLHQQNPAAVIDVLAAPVVAPVCRAMPEVNEVMITPFRHGALQLRQRWQFAQQLKQRHYQAAYVLPNTIKYALIPWLAGIPLRVGYKGESRYGLINRMHFDEQPPRPMQRFYAALAVPAKAYTELGPIPLPRLHINSDTQLSVAHKFALQATLRWLSFAPGAEFGPAKRWPASHFAELARLALQADANLGLILLGSAKEAEASAEIMAILAEHFSVDELARRCRNLASTTSLSEALAILAQSTAVVANDSGLLHMASALNRPVLACYGPTDPEHAPPFSERSLAWSLRLDCAPCKQRTCPLGHQACMQNLAPAQGWQHLRSLLSA